MAWKCAERADAIYPHSGAPRKTFIAGYSDGYYRYKRFASSDPGYQPTAYEGGYRYGLDDSQ